MNMKQKVDEFNLVSHRCIILHVQSRHVHEPFPGVLPCSVVLQGQIRPSRLTMIEIMEAEN